MRNCVFGIWEMPTMLTFFVSKTQMLLYFKSPQDQMDAVTQNKDIAFLILPIPAISASGTDPLRADSSMFLLALLWPCSRHWEGLLGHWRLLTSLALSSLAVGSSQMICSLWDGSVFISASAWRDCLREKPQVPYMLVSQKTSIPEGNVLITTSTAAPKWPHYCKLCLGKGKTSV